MKNYEMFLILTPELDDSKIDQSIKEVEAVLNKNDGKITDIEKIGKKRLGYKIKDKKDGNQVVLKLELDPTTINAIKKQLSITANILRYTMFSLEKEAV